MKVCQKTSKGEPKFVHCGEKFAAIYRGCHVAKKIQKLRSQRINKLFQRASRNEDPQTQKVTENIKNRDVANDAKISIPTQQDQENDNSLKKI